MPAARQGPEVSEEKGGGVKDSPPCTFATSVKLCTRPSFTAACERRVSGAFKDRRRRLHRLPFLEV